MKSLSLLSGNYSSRELIIRDLLRNTFCVSDCNQLTLFEWMNQDKYLIRYVNLIIGGSYERIGNALSNGKKDNH